MRQWVLLASVLVHIAGLAAFARYAQQHEPVKTPPEALQVSLMGDTSAAIPYPLKQQAPSEKSQAASSPSRASAAAPAAKTPKPDVATNSVAQPATVAPTPTAPSTNALESFAQQPAQNVPTAAPSTSAGSAPAGAQNPISASATTTTIPVRQGVSIDASYAASNPIPPYPAIAKKLGEQGTVVLRILVTAEGTAREVQIKKSSGSSTLDRSAETTLKQWRFNPARIDGKPVEDWYETRWIFKLEG